MSKSQFPPGWDEQRVRKVLNHYEMQSNDEAVAEDETAFEDDGSTFIAVPNDMLETIREMIAKRDAPEGPAA